MERVLAISGALIGINLSGRMFDKGFKVVGLEFSPEILLAVRHLVELPVLEQRESDGDHLVRNCHGGFLPELSSGLQFLPVSGQRTIPGKFLDAPGSLHDVPPGRHAAEFCNPKLLVHGAGLVLSGYEADVVPQLGSSGKPLPVPHIGDEGRCGDVADARDGEPGQCLSWMGEADPAYSLMDSLQLQFDGIQLVGQHDRSKVCGFIVEQDFCIIPSGLRVFQIGFLEIRVSLPVEDCMQFVDYLGVVLGIRNVEIYLSLDVK